VEAQPGAIGAGEFERYGGGRRRPGGGRRHFPKAQGYGGRRHGRRGWGSRPLFFAVCQAQPSRLGHARGRQCGGQRDGLIPERLGKALAGVRPRLAPVLKLRSSLLQLVLRVQRGLDLHGALHVIGFPL
jgi:hypothetical protein